MFGYWQVPVLLCHMLTAHVLGQLTAMHGAVRHKQVIHKQQVKLIRLRKYFVTTTSIVIVVCLQESLFTSHSAWSINDEAIQMIDTTHTYLHYLCRRPDCCCSVFTFR